MSTFIAGRVRCRKVGEVVSWLFEAKQPSTSQPSFNRFDVSVGWSSRPTNNYIKPITQPPTTSPSQTKQHIQT